jgi:hypothetical protein
MNLRKQALSRSSILVYVSLCLSTLGRFGFDRGVLKHTLMESGALVLIAATIFLFFDMRHGNDECVAGSRSV